MPRAPPTCKKCQGSLKGHTRDQCPSEHGHRITDRGRYTCSFIECPKTFTTLHSAIQHSTTICPEYEKIAGNVVMYPCPTACGKTFRQNTNAIEHAKSTACSNHPDRIANPAYRSAVHHEVKDGKKYCNGCKVWKDTSFFGDSKSSATKLAYTCCACHAVHAMFQNCVKRAKRDTLEPDFTLKDIQELATKTPICPIFGYTLQYGGAKSVNHSATVDACDHSKGHQKANLRIISRLANTIKNNSTNAEMKLLLDAVRSWTPPVVPDEKAKRPRLPRILLTAEQTTKVCSACRVEKDVKEYSKDASSKKLGIASKCRHCSALKAMVSNAKKRAAEQGVPFTITLDYIHSLAKDAANCPVLGIPFQYAGNKLCDKSASLDRFIPSKGYVPGNVWIICHKANRMKSDATPDEIEKVYRYMLGSG